ncbi:MAG TPA: hypothetical protein VEK08_01065 [Planctomycetota bacterium]|nr:hypothetical protein [Planctomycetota bacterium]
MRFSLSSLLLTLLWSCSAFTVLFLKEPWTVIERSTPTNFIARGEGRTPDGTRYFDGACVYDAKTHKPLWCCLWSEYTSSPMYKTSSLTGFFLDNETLEVALSANMGSTVIAVIRLKGRFPEQWWGHFCRPEVWVFGLLSVGLVIQARKRRQPV